MSPKLTRREQNFKRNWRLSVIAVLFTAIFTALFVVFGTSSDTGRSSDLWPAEAPVLPVKVEQVFSQDRYVIEQLYSGRLSALRTSDLAFETAGKIIQVIAEEGDLVEAGEVLARLDSSLLRASRKQLNAEIRASEERLKELINGPRTETIDQTEAQFAELSHQLSLGACATGTPIKHISSKLDTFYFKKWRI
jgi:multidrug efflux pump subunit AcrA (membrane-fusion protein)